MKRNILHEIKYSTVIIPILFVALIIGLIVFLYNSVTVFSDTNKTNFSYSSKILAAAEEIDLIVERGEVNIGVIADAVHLIYDVDKRYDEKYNQIFIERLNVLTKAALINSPGADGIWFELNSDLPFSNDLYCWYSKKNDRYIDLRSWFQKHGGNDRELNSQDDPYYFQAVKEKKLVWSNIYKDADTNTTMITASKPVFSHDGTLIGVVGVDFSLKDLIRGMANMYSLFPDSEILLLDLNSKIILSQPAIKFDPTSFEYISSSLAGAIKNGENMIELLENGHSKTAVILELSNGYHVAILFKNAIIFKGYSQLVYSIIFVFIIMLLLVRKIISNNKQIKKINVKLADESQKLRDVFDAFPNAVMVKDLQGRYVDCNRQYLEILGLSRSQVIGKTSSDLLHADLAKVIKDAEKQVIATQKLVVYDLSYPKQDGSGISYYQSSAVPLFDSNKNMIGLLIISIDISKAKEHEILLKKAKDAAEKATAMKSNFLANMSHEIRTPLNGILGFIQLLKDTITSEEQSEFITNAQKSSEILLNVINDILDFSKIEADKLQIDNISFNIRSVIEDITIISTASAEAKGLEVNSLICSDVPQKVYGDPGRIKQVLNNLVNNAIKFTSSGEIVICLKQEYSDDENSVIKFEVKDTGIGIEEDKLNLIFEAFTQADASMTRKYGGTGLGLAISQKLIKLMRGMINVETKLGEGSTFSFTLPFKKDMVAGEAVISKINSLAGAKILLVNSKQTDNKIMSYYLGEANCIIYQALSAEEALSILQRENYNVSAIVVDSKIQKSGEVEFSSLLKENIEAKNIPLILYVSMAHRGDSIKAKQKGFNGFLSKPLKKLDLIETISLVIGNVGNAENESKLVTKHVIKEYNFDSKVKILLVEDSEINRKLVCKILSNNNLVCDVATDGQEAVDAVKQKNYDLILMDCQMPVMDGYEATLEIRKLEGDSRHTPIIALTANALVKDDERCFKAGMDDYLSKPVLINELLSKIYKYVKEVPVDQQASSNTIDEEVNPSILKDDVENIINDMISELEFNKNEAVQLFAEYLESLPQSLSDLEQAIEQGDFDKIHKIAHTLKGSSSNLRVETISALGAMLCESALKNERNVCINLIEEIKNHLGILNSLLLKFIHDAS